MTPPRVLCVDTATPIAVVGLCLGRETVAEERMTSKRDHAERLLSTVETLLAQANWRLADLDALVVGVGPGSFIGVRIGVATVKGLALGCGRPVFGVSTPAMLALSTAEVGRVAVAMDAKKGQVYASVHQLTAAGEVESNPLPSTALDPEPCARILLSLGPLAARVGDGFERYADAFTSMQQVPLRHHAPGASSLAVQALPRVLAGADDELGSLEPFYARRSEAEEIAERRRTT
ncbi:MAG: tRNA (adenosine(37)-N6)-threonylcarbamoyltransferase complex dimerization subunit type 1 TsaB [Pseudomonadota bacterium]